MANAPKRHLQAYHSEVKYQMVMSIINNIRSKYLAKNERCSIAKAIEVLAVHYGNGHNLIHKGVPSGIVPYYYDKETMESFNNRISRIEGKPNNYNNMRVYMGLEGELRGVMDSRNELELEQNLMNCPDRVKGVKLMRSYIDKISMEFNKFNEKLQDGE